MPEQRKNGTVINRDVFANIAEGDVEAFRDLYYFTQKQVFSFLLSLTGNYNDAEDLMQETYLKIRYNSHLYHDEGSPMAWIFQIAKNEFLMKIRHDKNYANWLDFDDMENQIPYDKIQDVNTRMLLQAAFEHLKIDERTIVTLHITGGMKHREIAKILDLPLSTVLNKYNRSLKKLKSYIES